MRNLYPRGPGTPRAVILVRNPCVYDARVMREADALRSAGFEPVIVGVVSTTQRETRLTLRGTPVLRLDPQSPVRRLLRRVRSTSSSRPSQSRSTSSDGSASTGSSSRSRRLAIRLHRFLVTLDYYRLGIGAVRGLRPALIHCNDYNTMWIGVANRLTSRTAVIYDSHELWPDRNLRPEARWWLIACEAIFVRVAHRIITTSPGYAEVMAARYRVGRPLVIRNIPDTDPPSAGERTNTRAPVAIYAGALTVNRGIEQSIEALRELPDVRLRLIGPGSTAYVAELERRAEHLGVRDRVEFVPPVDPGSLIDALQRADVGLGLIQPACLSYRLTLPNKLFEYIAAGLPILGSDLPVIADFIRANGVGRVVGPSDVDGIARALQQLIDPRENERWRAGARGAARRLTWDHERQLLTSAYRNAVAMAN